MELANTVLDYALDQPPEKWIAALLAVLIYSLAVSGLCLLARRLWGDTIMPILGVMVVANTIAIALVAVATVHTLRERGLIRGTGEFLADRRYPGGFGPGRGMPGPGGPWPGPGRRRPFTRQFIESADTDDDGRVSPEEAARFVREADAIGKGSVDPWDLENALRDHDAPPPSPPPDVPDAPAEPVEEPEPPR